MEDAGVTWKALADPTRRSILDLLREAPRTTGELTASFPLSRFAVMKHLSVLERAGLVVVRRRGRERWNFLNPVPLQRIYERWMRPYEERWAASLVGLKRLVEQPEGVATRMSEAASDHVGRIEIEQEIVIEAPPSRVFHALTHDISSWWGPPYLHSRAAHDIILESEVGGRLYELWGDEQGALWAVVTAIRNDELLELTGAFGMAGPVYGTVAFSLESRASQTVLRLSHRAVGQVDVEVKMAYTSGWSDLLATRLKAFVEEGIRYGIGHDPPATAPDLGPAAYPADRKDW